MKNILKISEDIKADTRANDVITQLKTVIKNPILDKISFDESSASGLSLDAIKVGVTNALNELDTPPSELENITLKNLLELIDVVTVESVFKEFCKNLHSAIFAT